MAIPKQGDPCIYNDAGVLRPAVWIDFREGAPSGGTVRYFRVSPDFDSARGPDPDGEWSPDPTDAVFFDGDPTGGGLSPGQASYTYEGYLYDLAQKTDVIFPLTGYIGAAWGPGATPLESGGPLETLIINQKLTLGQVQTTRDQVRTSVVWQVQDRVGSPMTLECWNTTTSTQLCTIVTDGSGVNKDYQKDFDVGPGPQTGEFVYTAVAYSGAVGAAGQFRVFSARLLEVR